MACAARTSHHRIRRRARRRSWLRPAEHRLAGARLGGVRPAQVERIGCDRRQAAGDPGARGPRRADATARGGRGRLGVQLGARAHRRPGLRRVGGRRDVRAVDAHRPAAPSTRYAAQCTSLAARVGDDAERRPSSPLPSASTSRVQTPSTGMPSTAPRVRAVTSPTRSPVNGPGPTPTAIAGQVASGRRPPRRARRRSPARAARRAVGRRPWCARPAPARRRRRATVTAGVAVSRASSTPPSLGAQKHVAGPMGQLCTQRAGMPFPGLSEIMNPYNGFPHRT